MKICGIYSIVNNINGKVYVGSSIDIEMRWKIHKSTLSKSKYYGTNNHFQNEWNKYGEQNFEFSILEECAKDKLLEIEQLYIDKYKSLNRKFGYNMHPPKESWYGRHTEESKKKMSEKLKGRKITFSEEWKKNISTSAKKHASNFTGKQHTEETKKKMQLSARGKNRKLNLSDEDIIKIYKLIKEGIDNKSIKSMYNEEITSLLSTIRKGYHWVCRLEV